MDSAIRVSHDDPTRTMLKIQLSDLLLSEIDHTRTFYRRIRTGKKAFNLRKYKNFFQRMWKIGFA